ncbi:microtubule/TRAF3 and DISC1 binding protein [Streptomyces sp. Act143]|uniref:AAWKG family protein n=1 Tax=Streptomyces sp. Act143 TaxID=2200760 RepID=UPI000D67978E|nr:AAWKG family protein [Streptomyces sp. Act143]PWI13052.1 microtubule/TRAF3 and DISC1 binding protein [Streptomyces sp. Act143]
MALDPTKITGDLTATNDHWHEAIKLFTGYVAPARDTLFDTLVGNEGIPLMKVEISDVSQVDYVDTEDLNWLYENAGYQIQNTDFVIPFYSTSGSGGAGSDVSMHKARITLLGQKSGDSPPTGGYVEGGTFTSQYDNHLGMGKPTWDTRPLAQYSYGTGLALEALLNKPEGTHGFTWNEVSVDEAASVTLANFDVVAGAFDRVAKFFVDQQKKIEEWQTRVGVEKNDAWRGTAAGVFWDLVKKLNKQYGDYADDMSPNGSYFSKQGNEVRDAKKALRAAAWDLHTAWATWEYRDGNPLGWLHALLSRVMKHVWDHNITKITYEIVPSYSEAPASVNYVAEAGFDNTAKDPGDAKTPAREFGDLKDLGTWAQIGNQAILDWQKSVVDQLDKAAVEALKDVKDAWSKSTFDLGAVKSRGGSSLEEGLAKDEAELAQEKADKAAAEAAAQQAAYMQWMKDQAAKAEAEAAAAKAEQEAKEKAAEEKAAKEKAEQEAKEKAAEEKAEQKEREAEAKAAAAKAEQEAKEKAAEEKAEQKEKEQEAKQAEAEAKAEQKEAEAKAEQEAKEKEAEAKAEQKEKEQEAKQAEAQARQEQLQIAQMNQAKAEQERQRKEQEQKEAEAEAKAEQKEKEAEAKQAEQEAEQEAKEREAEARAEQKEKEQEAKQAEAEAKAEQKEAEAKAEQEAKEKEQEAKQAEAEAKAEQKQAEQEQKQAEAEAEQQRLQQEAARREQEALAQYDSARQEILNNGDLSQLSPTTITGPVNDGTLDLPGGGETHIDSNGRVVTEYPDGSSATIDPVTHSSTVTRGDGTTFSGPLNTGDLLNNPDGSVTHLDANGHVITEYPDGTVQTVDPDTGSTTVTLPDGTTSSGYLNGGDLPSYGSSSSPSPSYDHPSYEEELYDDTPYQSPLDYSGSGTAETASSNRRLLNTAAFPGLATTGGGLDGTAGSTASTGSGTPMGGMPMGGMGGMGAGGGAGNNDGERVRNVIDSDVISNRRTRTGSGGARAHGGYADDEVRVAAAGPTAGATPFLPPAGGGGVPGRPETQSGNRAREAWEPEDEDVWGADEGGAPAVIGR